MIPSTAVTVCVLYFNFIFYSKIYQLLEIVKRTTHRYAATLDPCDLSKQLSHKVAPHLLSFL